MGLDAAKMAEYLKWGNAAPTAHGFLDCADTGVMVAHYWEAETPKQAEIRWLEARIQELQLPKVPPPPPVGGGAPKIAGRHRKNC